MLVRTRKCPRTNRVRFFVFTECGWRMVSGHSFESGRLTGRVSVSGSRRMVDVRGVYARPGTEAEGVVR